MAQALCWLGLGLLTACGQRGALTLPRPQFPPAPSSVQPTASPVSDQAPSLPEGIALPPMAAPIDRN